MYVVGLVAFDAADFGRDIRRIDCQFASGAYSDTGADVRVCYKIDLRNCCASANNIMDGRQNSCLYNISFQ